MSSSASVHPTAIVDPTVRLEPGAVVGPHCVLRGQVTIGEGTRLIGNVYAFGPIAIGRHNTIGPFVSLGSAPQDRKYDPDQPGAGTVIGDDNVLREGVTVNRATGDKPTTLGNRNYLMVNSHLGHDCRVGDECTFANNAVLGGHCLVEDRVMLGGQSGVHQFCRIGRLAMLSGGAGVHRDLPPFCVTYTTRTVGSLNIVGLRRAGLRDHVRPLTDAFDILFRQGHTNKRAVELIEQAFGSDPLCAELAQFVRASKRGICKYQRAAAAANDE